MKLRDIIRKSTNCPFYKTQLPIAIAIIANRTVTIVNEISIRFNKITPVVVTDITAK